MTNPQLKLADNYTPAFLTYLNHPDEETLHTAYELGRPAIAPRPFPGVRVTRPPSPNLCEMTMPAARG